MPAAVHALCDVRRLPSDVLRDLDIVAADRVLLAPEPLVRLGVADLVHGNPYKCCDVLRRMLRRAGDFPAKGDVVILNHDFKREPCHRVFFKEAVEDEAGQIVRGFIRVAEGHPFASFVHKQPHICSMVSA